MTAVGVTKGEVCFDPTDLLLGTWQIALIEEIPLGTRSAALALRMAAGLRSWGQARAEILPCFGCGVQVHLLKSSFSLFHDLKNPSGIKCETFPTSLTKDYLETFFHTMGQEMDICDKRYILDIFSNNEKTFWNSLIFLRHSVKMSL